MNLSRLSFGEKLAVTFILINVLLGLLFGVIEIRHAIGSKDGEPGISMADIKLYFQGDPTRCQLQTQIHGSMHNRFASHDEVQAIDEWIAGGATSEGYAGAVEQVFAQRCVSCHGPGGERAVSPLTAYEEVSRFVQSMDTGVSYDHLAAISYQHIMLMTCLTALVVGLFYLTRYTGAWKQVLMAAPFAAIFCDVLSWWSAKQSDMFLHIIGASILVLGISLIVMPLLILIEVWVLPQD